MHIGVTVLYFDLIKQNANRISIVLNIKANVSFSLIDKQLNTFAKKNNLEYIGIIDVFQVGGAIKNGQFLGRHTWYSKNNLYKANNLFNKLKINHKLKKGLNLVELYYFYKNEKPFSLSILSLFNSDINNKKSIVNYAESLLFKKKISKLSSDLLDFNNLKFIGIIKINSANYYDRRIIELDVAKINRIELYRMKIKQNIIENKIKQIIGNV